MTAAATAKAVGARLAAADANGLNAALHWSQALIDAEAARVDAAGMAGPLGGLPVALKDNIVTTQAPTTCASRILEGYISPYDATAVRRLRAAGAMLVAKANMDEFAMGSSTEHSAFGRVRHPLDPDRVPGGSSGGSAALVAAGVVPAALGSETGGSVRQPASFCGVVGVKPSYGRVSRHGLVAFGSSLDCISVFGETVETAGRVLAAISGHDPLDATTLERPPMVASPPLQICAASASAYPASTSRPTCIRVSPPRWTAPGPPSASWAPNWWTCRSRTRRMPCLPTTSWPRPRRRPTSPGTTACATARGESAADGDIRSLYRPPAARASARRFSAGFSSAPTC